MAIYRCEIKTYSRAKGETAVAAAAYRARSVMQNEFIGKEENYTRKKGLVHTEIVLPANSPEWAKDSNRLWNEVEKAEGRKNSTVAREFLVSLPHELSDDQRKSLSHEISQNLVDRFGFALQYSIHAPDKKDGLNHHVHILASTRRLESNGFGIKTRELDLVKSGAVFEVREMVADTINHHLHAAGLNITVSHKSLADQQKEAASNGDIKKFIEVNRKPTISIGHNPAVRQIRLDQNQAIQQRNLGTKNTFLDILKKTVNPIHVQPQAQPLSGTDSSIEADGSIADIEKQIGDIEAAIATLRLKPGKASELQIAKKLALKQKLTQQLKIAVAKRAEKKSMSKPQSNNGLAQQLQQPQQSPSEKTAEVEETGRVQKQIDELQRQAKIFEKKAMEAPPTEKMQYWSKAFELDIRAKELEAKIQPAQLEMKKKVGMAFKPKGMR